MAHDIIITLQPKLTKYTGNIWSPLLSVDQKVNVYLPGINFSCVLLFRQGEDNFDLLFCLMGKIKVMITPSFKNIKASVCHQNQRQ